MSFHPDYPIVSGTIELLSGWSLELDQSYNRRVEDGSLVLWRSGFTIWIIVWENTHNQSIESRLKKLLDTASPNRFDTTSKHCDHFDLLTYQLVAEEEGDPPFSVYGHAIGPDQTVQIAVYFDESDCAKAAQNILNSIDWVG